MTENVICENGGFCVRRAGVVAPYNGCGGPIGSAVDFLSGLLAEKVPEEMDAKTLREERLTGEAL